jgi:hypothetical protein
VIITALLHREQRALCRLRPALYCDCVLDLSFGRRYCADLWTSERGSLIQPDGLERLAGCIDDDVNFAFDTILFE